MRRLTREEKISCPSCLKQTPIPAATTTTLVQPPSSLTWIIQQPPQSLQAYLGLPPVYFASSSQSIRCKTWVKALRLLCSYLLGLSDSCWVKAYEALSDLTPQPTCPPWSPTLAHTLCFWHIGLLFVLLLPFSWNTFPKTWHSSPSPHPAPLSPPHVAHIPPPCRALPWPPYLLPQPL